MLDSFYTAASGMLQQQRTINVISNNIANVNTAGFKIERVVSSTFQQTYLTALENGKYRYLGTGDPVRTIEDVVSMYGENLLSETGRPFDFALAGEGYFTIQSGENAYLTRNGAFDRDAEGYLVLPGQGRVQGLKGDINLKNAEFTVTNEGYIIDGDGKLVDKLLIQKIPNNIAEDGTEQLANPEKYANGMYVLGGEDNTEVINNPTVFNNVLERANIDLNREYTLMMEAQRTFQSCSSALKMIDEINAKTTGIASVL